MCVRVILGKKSSLANAVFKVWDRIVNFLCTNGVLYKFEIILSLQDSAGADFSAELVMFRGLSSEESPQKSSF